MKSRYSILIQWSDEDRCYIVTLPEFGNYAHTHGDTYEEAIKNAQEVLELLIEDNNNLPQPNVYQSEALC
jgi:predicted RNase H-like HicB family nuclease